MIVNIAMQDTPTHIAMLLLPAFNSMAAHSFIDPFRVANYLKRQNLYAWQFVSLDGKESTASNGLNIAQTTAYSDLQEQPDIVVINSSWTPEKFQDDKLRNWLRILARNQVTLVGIDTGAFVMAYAGLLEQRRATVHFEHSASFRELFPNTELLETLYCIDGLNLSCCGGFAAADLALEIILEQQGNKLANEVANYIFKERLRSSQERQLPSTSNAVSAVASPHMKAAIELMEAHLEEPLSIATVASTLGISQRKLERLFASYLQMPPVRYYLHIRLERAHALLTQTNLSIAEIASACGFHSSEHFSRAYKKRFRTLPSLDRREGRIPFQFREFARANT